jgi:phosphoenolpyruvate synthase/pyruvate phosphate dikinase
MAGTVKWVYGSSEGDGSNKMLLGEKGANPCETTRIGLPVTVRLLEPPMREFLPSYYDAGIPKDNPFEVLDVKGVGELMKLAIAKGRAQRPELKVGICGEHGGEPSSIRFCHHAGLNYVSCSGPRVPIARLAAAHARLREAEYGEE